MKNTGPCHGCDHRTVTCHGVCKDYQKWKEEDHAKKEWLKDQKPITSQRLIQGNIRYIKSKARGYMKGRKHYD